jgi:hypothetical protein
MNDRNEERLPELTFEPVSASDWRDLEVRRAKVPGGWLVLASWGAGRGGLAFYPDPDHEWTRGPVP